jgi:Family of unknown function (DUF6263)
MQRKILNLFVILSFSLFVTSCGGDPVELKLNVTKGDAFACLVKMDMKVTTSTMGMNMNIDQIMEINQTLSVDEVDASGNVTFKNVMDRFYIKQGMKMMGMPVNIEFDTDKPEKAGAMGESMEPYFSKMKGLTYTIQMDNHGKLLSTNIDEIYEGLGLDSLTQKGGSSNSGSGNADQYMSQLPDKPVKKGDTYIVENKSSKLSPIATKNTYTIKEITADVVKMDVVSEFLPVGEEVIEGMKMEVKGEQSGTVEIDRKTGMTIKSDIKQNLDMNITTAGMKMPMKTSGTIAFTCTKK